MLKKAIELCKYIENICPKYGFHVGLTGGVLYKEGERKDIDLVLYRIRQSNPLDNPLDFEIDLRNLIDNLVDNYSGLRYMADIGFVQKMEYDGYNIDILLPNAPEQWLDYSKDGDNVTNN